jgi:hypothetical protein
VHGRASWQRSQLRLGALIVAGALLFGLAASAIAARRHAYDVVALAVVFLPVAVWRRPQLGPVVLIVTALLVEQNGALITPSFATVNPSAAQLSLVASIPITSRIPVFQGLGSLHLEPADLLVLMVLFVYLVRTDAWGPRWWPRSQVAAAIGVLLGFVLLGLFVGQMHHGHLREAFQEVRPMVYLASTYFLTSALIRSREAFHTMLWAFVIAEAIKACQGLDVWFHTRHWVPRPDAILAHEEAYFFSIFLILVAALWLFGVQGRLRKVATYLLPLIIFVDMVNNRRAAWLMLGAGMLTLLVIGWVQLPHRRRTLFKIVTCVLMFMAVYVPAFWHSEGTLAEPAHAIKSIFSPDARDKSSNLYRTEENANLQYNIKHDGLLGAGYGVPINYALPINDLRKADPTLDYIPHNDVLYVLMRLGILGSLAFWALLAAAIRSGCRLTRAPDREIAAVGAVTACMIVAYALEGATDNGFYFYRIAFVTGCFLGLAEAGRHLLAMGRGSTESLPR